MHDNSGVGGDTDTSLAKAHEKLFTVAKYSPYPYTFQLNQRFIEAQIGNR